VTCHNPMPGGFSSDVRMAPEEFHTYLELVDEAREEWEGLVDVRLGLEADYFEGYESWLEEQLSSHDFHYVLGSVHPQIREYKARYQTDDPVAKQENYFDLLAVAAETGLFDCLAHPDLIKNETSQHWEPETILPSICHALDRIAVTGIAMELNTSGANKVVPEMNPFPDMLKEIQKREIPIVIGADAHEPGRVADQFDVALDLLSSVGFTEVSYFLERRRQTVPIDLAKASLTNFCPTL
ncbi:MAG: histidinol-phosphatase, partial [Planctomycetaceae bacterium]|nr:histidinol-phosphatase [Planctomycetaceae bacterium]